MNDEHFLKAVDLHKSGKLDQAKKLYEQVLRSDQKNFQIHLLLGILNNQDKNYKQAIIHLSNAEKIDEKDITLLMNLATAFHKLNNFDRSINYINKVLRLNPSNSDALNNLGNIYKDANQLDKSIEAFDKAIKLNHKNNIFKLNKANALIKFRKYNLALSQLDLIQHDKELFSEVNKSYIKIFIDLKEYDKTIIVCRKFLSRDYISNSDREEITSRLISTLLTVNELTEIPNLLEKLTNEFSQKLYRALYLFKKKSFEESKNILLDLSKIYKQNNQIFHNLGEIYLSDLDYKNAIKCFKKSIEINPTFNQSKISLGLCQLALNNYIEGLKNFLSYQDTEEFLYKYPLIGEKWKGENEASPTCIYLDQGVGDAIFFANLISELENFNNDFYFVCDTRLKNIFSRSFNPKYKFITIKELRSSKIKFKFSNHGTFLFQLFEKQINSLKFEKYLVPTKLKINKPIKNNLVAGISWDSKNPTFGKDKSIKLVSLIKKLKNKYSMFINLQYGNFDLDLEQIEKKFNIKFIKHNNDNFNDLEGLMNLMRNCDEIFTIDNTAVHLSGAMGIKTNLLLPNNHSKNCWFWNAHLHNQSHWYPSVKIHWASKNSSLEDIKI